MVDTEVLSLDELLAAWTLLSPEERFDGFKLLSHEDSQELFISLEARDQAELLAMLPPGQRKIWIRALAPDDAVDVIQESSPEQRPELLTLLDDATRKEVSALLAYEEDEAGGLMNPRYVRLRPEMSVDEAIRYLRRQGQSHLENLYYPYVLDSTQHLLGVVSLRELITAPPTSLVQDMMTRDVVTVGEQMHQEEVSNVFAEHDLVVIPVVDEEGRLKGVVTVDDIVDVVREEATEDIQKFGATEALDAPYLQVSLVDMVRKRVPWLAGLLILGFAAVLAMHAFKDKIEKAEILAMFVPLIISSGGNSGTQAATLVVRAMALGEISLREWARVIRRELAVGAVLGLALGLLALVAARVYLHFGEGFDNSMSMRVTLTVATSVFAVAAWGTIVGSMLPFFLRRCGFDPASASAPFVATIVDASGMVIYFSVAGVMLAQLLDTGIP